VQAQPCGHGLVEDQLGVLMAAVLARERACRADSSRHCCRRDAARGLRAPEREALQLEREPPTAVEELSARNIAASGAEGREGRWPERIDQGCRDPRRVE